MGHITALSLAVLAATHLGPAAACPRTPLLRRQLADRTPAALAAALPATAQILSADYVQQGGGYGEGAANIAYPTVPTDLPALCALTVNVTSSASSAYRFALLLPLRAEDWNGRFLAVGNGGFAGGINWVDAAVGLRYGFAAASTDTGHNSTVADGRWALGQPERQADWGWRAIHGTAVLAQALVAAYYGETAHHAYYSGCSTGGRQGLREAQLHPETFDGLLVGAPAWWTSHLQPWTTWLGAANLPEDAPHRIPPALFAPLADEVLRQCDGADGVVDGIVSDPAACRLDYGALECSAPGTSGPSGANASPGFCLTAAQIATLRKAYEPYVVDGALVMPGISKSSERLFPVVLGGADGEPSGLGTGYERYFLLGEPDWPWQSYNDSIVALADRLDPGSATARDFAAMAAGKPASGGKILMYHGLADGLIPAGSSEHFYAQVAAAAAAATDGGNGQPQSLRDWFRFFLVPGLGHCAGTSVDAPWYFAGANQGPAVTASTYSVPGFADARHDALLALVAWVEDGAAVDAIVATTWKKATDPTSGVLRQRPLCPYPEMAVWDRVGNVDEAGSWRCAPKK